MPGPGVAGIAESQRVQHRDRPSAHGEDVAQDAADAGRSTLVRLDGRGVVMRLDLERDRLAVADGDHAGVLARPGHDAVAGGRQGLEQRLRALVRAVLAPHDREHGELEVVRVAPAEPVTDRVQLIVGDAQAAMERLHRTLRQGHQMPTVTRRSPTAFAALSTSERMMPAPSSEPRMASDARSGWGMSPATLPAALMTPAMARSDPFGFAARSSSAAAFPSPLT